MEILKKIELVKNAGRTFALLEDHQRNDALCTFAHMLRGAKDRLLTANAKDLEQFDPVDPMFDRLLLDEGRVQAIADDIERVAALPAPLQKEKEHRTMPNGLVIQKITVPLGVVAIVYESRPNVTADAFALCFKSGNAVVLKGGKEALQSNLALVDIIHRALKHHGIDSKGVLLLPTDRKNLEVVLKARGLVDVCIPRGGKNLIEFVREHARIPIIETGAGVVHLYFDAAGDTAKGSSLIHNSKTRRVSVCNALDCVLVHAERLHDLPSLLAPLLPHNVILFADPTSYKALSSHFPPSLLRQAQETDFGKEFLSYALAVRVVASADEAIAHISRHTSGHSEVIVTEDPAAAQNFITQIDAAVVYVNVSSAFTDGGQFGMGAEIGISTQKLHARGPMGLDALTSDKWIVRGNGQTRA